MFLYINDIEVEHQLGIHQFCQNNFYNRKVKQIAKCQRNNYELLKISLGTLVPNSRDR